MIVPVYIYHRNGSVRRVDKAVPDVSDPSNISTFYADFPPFQAVDFQLDPANEIEFTSPQTPAQVQAAFAAQAAQIPPVP